MEKYYRVKNIFAENKIPYKDTSTNNQLLSKYSTIQNRQDYRSFWEKFCNS